ncbi:MAG: ATPase, partial [Corynebacterium variabile]|nr:ATPase [Corynebacterium variabile]
MWTDNETDRDFLNFEGVADTIAEVIVSADGRPVSIGVSGAWGVGKSSMIKLTKTSLAKHQPVHGANKFVFVEFNAWLYQGYDDARAALLEVIANRLEAESEARKTGIDKAKDFLSRVRWFRLAKLVALPAASMALGLPPIGLAGEIAGAVKDATSGNLTNEGMESLGKQASDTASAASALVKPKDAVSPPKEIQALRDSFEEAIEALGITLVVLIDDLDRCMPDTTISTLEAIRLFLFLDHTAFVIAADDNMIKHAVKKHFGGLEDDELITNYFDTLVQIPNRVPALGMQEV